MCLCALGFFSFCLTRSTCLQLYKIENKIISYLLRCLTPSLKNRNSPPPPQHYNCYTSKTYPLTSNLPLPYLETSNEKKSGDKSSPHFRQESQRKFFFKASN